MPAATLDTKTQGQFGRRFAGLFLLGLPGIAVLPLTLLPALRDLPLPPDALSLPTPLLAALSLVQPTLLLAGAVALDTALAPRVGLRSHLVERVEGRRPPGRALRTDALVALAAGAVATLVVLLIDVALWPYLGEAAQALPDEPRTLATTVVGLLYGGITEELIVRWGLVSLFAWAGARLVRQAGSPGPAVMLTAIALAAVLFGVMHLPAMSLSVPLTPAVVGRTIGLNALLGLVFGVLFWRRSLEAAMIAHATFHLVLSALAWSGVTSFLLRLS